MNYKLKIDDARNYIAMKVFSDITIDHAREIARVLADAADRSKIQRVFCDVRGAKNVISTYDNYTYGYKDMAELGLRQNIRSAVLTDRDDKSHNFVETVVQNAGYVSRMFTDENEAVEWFFQGDADESNKKELFNLLNSDFVKQI